MAALRAEWHEARRIVGHYGPRFLRGSMEATSILVFLACALAAIVGGA